MEFAIVAVVFFTVIFGILEVARVMYLYNTLQEVTRRAASAAANAAFSDAALGEVRRNAIFQTAAGGHLPLSDQVTEAAVRIEHLSLQRDTGGTYTVTAIDSGSLPAGPAENRRACLINPEDASCVRLIRVRICDPNIRPACERIRFRSFVPLIDLGVTLPRATTVTKAESLGLLP